MQTKLFLNLPVKDLERSIAFFTALGFEFDPKFTNESATCMIINKESFVMLLVEEFFQTFTKKTIADARKTVQAMIALSTESRDTVDSIIVKARSAGATVYEKSDQGFMYTNAFEDLDGHIWEIFYMDTAPFEEAIQNEANTE